MMRRRYSPRRFPHEIHRKRTGAETVNDYGETVPGKVTMTALRANVQPISREDGELIAGDRLVERFTIYVPEPDALLAIRESAPADKVGIEGRSGDYVVETSATWFGSHTRAIVLRED